MEQSFPTFVMKVDCRGCVKTGHAAVLEREMEQRSSSGTAYYYRNTNKDWENSALYSQWHYKGEEVVPGL